MSRDVLCCPQYLRKPVEKSRAVRIDFHEAATLALSTVLEGWGLTMLQNKKESLQLLDPAVMTPIVPNKWHLRIIGIMNPVYIIPDKRYRFETNQWHSLNHEWYDRYGKFPNHYPKTTPNVHTHTPTKYHWNREPDSVSVISKMGNILVISYFIDFGLGYPLGIQRIDRNKKKQRS